MKLHLIFIGNKFIYNRSLKEYVLRNIEKKVGTYTSVNYFLEGDNSLFLHLEEQLNKELKIIIVATKKSFSTIGKLLCTVTSDNQVLEDGMLIPQKCSLFTQNSYLLEYQQASVNVLQVDEEQKIPDILLTQEVSRETLQVFDESVENVLLLLTPLAQTYNVKIDVVELINGWLEVHLSSDKFGDVTQFVDSAKQLLSKNIITNRDIVLHIIEKLTLAKKKVSFAESCTGGLLAYLFTKREGVSAIFDGSLVTYSNILKENWLAVEHQSLESHGAVSSEIVEQMSEGVMSVSSADYALSISGIAGSSGGTEEKPVGTVYVSVRSQKEHKEIHLQLEGDRNYIQYQSALHAIKMLVLLDKDTFF